MELERMREVLALGMGWTRSERMDGAWYVDGDGNPLTRYALWEPWESWEQCGMVIEAMRRDYMMNIFFDGTYYTARFYRDGEHNATSDKCPYAVSLAAARALESEATGDTR